MEIGDAAFDAADRLAIINLFGAYAQTFDENRLDEFRALFTESPEIRFESADHAHIEGIDTVMSFLKARREAFEAENHQRRHAMNSYCFTSQSATEVTGRCYVQIFGTRDAGPPSPDVTGYYDFTAEKHGGVWRFRRWLHQVDQASP